MPTQVAVVGAGPAGLMAAEGLAGAGFAVTVYERLPSPARKLLMAGRGGLNLTHVEPLPGFLRHYGPAEPWLAPLVAAFDNAALRAWVEGLGEPTFVGSSGRVFPRSLKASPLVRAWLARLDLLGVRVLTRHTWQGFTPEAGLRFARDGAGELVVRPAAAVLALGGASWPRLGADGAWVALLRAAGVAVAPLRPANVGVLIPWSKGFVERFAGAPLKTVTATAAGQVQKGDLVVTAYGLEGGPVYTLGPAIRAALDRDAVAGLVVDLKPDTAEPGLARRLAAAVRKGRSRGDALRRAGLSPLAVALLREAAPDLPKAPAALAALVKALPLRVTGQAGLARAISSAGGIARAAVDDRLMLRARPGVFVCGEMLDWEAPTGGYLLQACFATGRHAAAGVIDWLARRS